MGILMSPLLYHLPRQKHHLLSAPGLLPPTHPMQVQGRKSGNSNQGTKEESCKVPSSGGASNPDKQNYPPTKMHNRYHPKGQVTQTGDD